MTTDIRLNLGGVEAVWSLEGDVHQSQAIEWCFLGQEMQLCSTPPWGLWWRKSRWHPCGVFYMSFNLLKAFYPWPAPLKKTTSCGLYLAGCGGIHLFLGWIWKAWGWLAGWWILLTFPAIPRHKTITDGDLGRCWTTSEVVMCGWDLLGCVASSCCCASSCSSLFVGVLLVLVMTFWFGQGLLGILEIGQEKSAIALSENKINKCLCFEQAIHEKSGYIVDIMMQIFQSSAFSMLPEIWIIHIFLLFPKSPRDMWMGSQSYIISPCP